MKLTMKEMIQISLLTALLAVTSLIVVPIGPVPITLQTFTVFLISLILEKSRAMMVMCLYFLLGMIGLPVFAGGNGGPQSFLSPAFGYVIGFIAVSLIIGTVTQVPTQKITLLRGTTAILLGIVILYLIGTGYTYLILTKYQGVDITYSSVAVTSLISFFPVDLIKGAFALLLAMRLAPQLNKKAS